MGSICLFGLEGPGVDLSAWITVFFQVDCWGKVNIFNITQSFWIGLYSKSELWFLSLGISTYKVSKTKSSVDTVSSSNHFTRALWSWVKQNTPYLDAFHAVLRISRKYLLFLDGVQLPQGYSHFEEAVYFLPVSSQKFLVLILPTSEGWKAESILESPSGFEQGTPGLGIQRLNH